MISSLTREGSCSSARTDVMVPWRGIHGGASYHYMLINANSRFFCHSFVLLVEPRFYTLSALVLPLRRRWEETEANRKESISTSTPRGTMPRRLPSLNSIVASVLHLPRRQHTRHLNNFFAGMSEPLFTVTTVLRQGLPSLEALTGSRGYGWHNGNCGRCPVTERADRHARSLWPYYTTEQLHGVGGILIYSPSHCSLLKKL